MLSRPMASTTMLGLFCLSSLFTMKVIGPTAWYSCKVGPDVEPHPRLIPNAIIKNNVPEGCVLLACHDPD